MVSRYYKIRFLSKISLLSTLYIWVTNNISFEIKGVNAEKLEKPRTIVFMYIVSEWSLPMTKI